MNAPAAVPVALPKGPFAGVLVDPDLCDPGAEPIDRFRGKFLFLSNYHGAPHLLTGPLDNGIVWATTEHSFNAGKDGRRGVREWIASAPNPNEAKRRGNSRKDVLLVPGWDKTARYERMTVCVSAKFRAHPGRVAALLGTGRRPLVEGNVWHDQIWGSCSCGRDACGAPGQNALGSTLMVLRLALSLGQ